MNNYTKALTLDIGKRYLLSPVYAKQGDMASRYLKITMMNGDTQYKPASGNTAKFRALKPDGNSVMNPATINSDGTVTCELTEQTLACAGVVKADVVILDGTNKALASASFDIAVERAPIGEDLKSDNEFAELIEIIEQAPTIIANSNAAATNAAAAQTAATAANTAATRANNAADTVAAIDDTVVSTTAWSSKHIVDELCPAISETGNPVQCYPLKGYPLTATASWTPTQSGSGDPSPTNIRPITGRDSVTVQVTSENILPEFTYSETGNGITWLIENGKITATGTASGNSAAYFSKEAKALLKNCLRAGSTVSALLPENVQLAIYDSSWNGKTLTGTTKTVTFPDNMGDVNNIYFQVMDGATVNVSEGYATLVYGSTVPTKHTPYKGTTQTLTLPETIYGGSVGNDGAGEKKWHSVTLTGTENWKQHTGGYFYLNDLPANANSENGSCSHFKYKYNYNNLPKCVFLNTIGQLFANKKLAEDYTNLAAWKSYLAAQYAAGTPVQICYKLATPTTFTATGSSELTGLDGMNNVLTDADSVTVEGREDIKHTIQELQDALASVQEG